ncbi:MAG TPA: hypothetical protein VHU44_04580 [Acidobacteriaceae bacterium]|jgi:hypothetical protein|nr:hypothetical protein [Acidobacteriaceae bacterium]
MILNSFRITLCVSSLVCAAAFSGCSSAPASKDRADYAKSLNRYYEGRPMCVWTDQVSFPVENATPEQIKDRGYDALVSAGLLTQRDSKGSTAAYYLTAAGSAAFDHDIANKNTGNFCYGRRRVTAVASADHDSPATELVEYQYTVAEPPAWAHDDAVQAAFPQIASDLSGPHTAKTRLLNTTEGWEVVERPAHPSNGERTSSLAKMKAVFAPGS